MNLGKMPIVAVVRSDKEYGHFGKLGKIKLSIFQVPQDLFRAIAIEIQVNRISRREVPLPNSPQLLIFAAEFTEGMRDGAANQNEVIVARPDRRDFFIMARVRCWGRIIGITQLR